MTESRKTVLITGCSPGGIGHALALEFHAKKYRVFATARQTSSVSDLAALGIETLSLEAHQPDSIASLKSQVQALTGGTLDVLVNNAGRNYVMPALDLDLAEVQALFDVNVFAVMRMCQAFAPLLIKAHGTIVQIGSLAAVVPYAFGSAYNASKAALHAYSSTLRVELAPLGVKVVTVVTGGVKSNISRTARRLPDGSFYLPLKDVYHRRQTYSQEDAMPTEAYARAVVEHVTRQSPPSYLWRGNKSALVWWLTNFTPTSFLDLVISRLFTLWKLAPQYTEKTTKTA